MYRYYVDISVKLKTITFFVIKEMEIEFSQSLF